jgi:hypothetical protein
MSARPGTTALGGLQTSDDEMGEAALRSRIPRNIDTGSFGSICRAGGTNVRRVSVQ